MRLVIGLLSVCAVMSGGAMTLPDETCDVAVVGGGTAGVPAALQSAKAGAKTILIEQGFQVGGTMTTGGVNFPGLFHAWGKQVIDGVGYALVTNCVALAGGKLPDFEKPTVRAHWHHQILINIPLYVALAEEALTEAGVRIHYHAAPTEVTFADGVWTLKVAAAGDVRRIRARQLVDCTGNAAVAALVGCERLRGETRQPGSFVYTLDTGVDVATLDRDALNAAYEAARADGRLRENDTRWGIFNFLKHRGNTANYVDDADNSTADARTETNLRGRASMLRMYRFVRSVKGLEKASLVSMSPEVGIRETYRIVGEYMLSQDDYVTGRHFHDSLCYAFYPIDMHDKKNGIKPAHLKEGVVATVPLRALVPKGSRNLLVAGRCVSSDRGANSALRVEASCMAMGQVAGEVAALAALSRCAPLEVSLDAARKGLVASGAIVPEPMPDETAAIQDAIDRAWQSGGGKVVIAPGVHHIGGLRLRSNVELHLASNAVLSASRNCDDFEILAGDKLEPVSKAWQEEMVGFEYFKRDRKKPWLGASNPLIRWNNGVIRILSATNVVISGEHGSAIDGNNSFDENGEEHYRGVHGINCFYSTNVTVRGVELRNTGNWATRFAHSADLVFENLTIRGGHDGVHVRGCDRVRVSRCDIRCGDDAIAGFDNSDVAVEDCALNTACSAFRFGGTHVRVRRCRAWGPAEWPFRGKMSMADKRAGVSSQGRGRKNMLSLWTYFADLSQPIRNPPGDIVIEDCAVENADRLLHYNFSGNEVWQVGMPLADIRFERIKATGIGMSVCAYGKEGTPLALAFKDCEISFRQPVSEFVRAASLGSLLLEDVIVNGVQGPCVRSWKGTPKISVKGKANVGDKVEQATEPFKTHRI